MTDNYTVVHDQWGETFVRYTIETVGECEYDFYAQGLRPPHYPVPAIRYQDYHYWDDGVTRTIHLNPK